MGRSKDLVRLHQLCGTCSNTLQSSRIIEAYLNWQDRGICIWTRLGAGERLPHPERADLEKAAKRGCHMCAVFTDKELHTPNEKRSAWFMTSFGTDSVGLTIRNGEEWSPEPLCELTVRTAKGFAETPDAVSNYTGSRSVFHLARTWLRQCSKTHSHCYKGKTSTGKPPRWLLSIKKSPQHGFSLRLVDSTRDTPRYACLSHCWGTGDDVVKLLMCNIKNFCVDIPWLKLPKTFRDAIKTTHELGIDHLWIDSLCIEQDSEMEKASEIANMGSIYQGSVLTIAALHGENSSAGCFVRRDPRLTTSCRASLDSDRAVVILSYPKHGPGGKETEPGRPWLHTRAWVLQERAMAPRTLYFGSEMVFWECVECVASEASPVLASSAEELHVKDVFQRRITTNKADWRDHWWRLISEYSTCKLTFVDDRWRAIEGLAHLLEQRLSQQLICGLWKDHLATELLWTAQKQNITSQRVRVAAWPTWSWLSLLEPVHFDVRNYPDIQAAATFAIQEDVTDVLNHQRKLLSIEAPLIALQRHLSTQDDEPDKNTDTKVYKLTYDLTSIQRSSPETYGKLENTGDVFTPIFDLHDYSTSDMCPQLYALQLGYRLDPNTDIHRYGLIIARVDADAGAPEDGSEPTGCFERVGTFEAGQVPARDGEEGDGLWDYMMIRDQGDLVECVGEKTTICLV